jgi:signal transduction histidine kinase
VYIEAQSQNGMVQVSVKDSGIGIAPDHLPYIFERFYRADRSRTRSTGGAGLGLAIVKKIVEAHGGQVSAESVLEKGTTINFTLPTIMTNK